MEKSLKVDHLKVVTEQVVAVANEIKNLNDQILDEFNSVQNKITSLDENWDGIAARNVVNKFNAIKNTYSTQRYNAVDNFVAFLHHQVGEDYEQVEEANKSLAERFK